MRGLQDIIDQNAKAAEQAQAKREARNAQINAQIQTMQRLRIEGGRVLDHCVMPLLMRTVLSLAVAGIIIVAVVAWFAVQAVQS